MHSQGHHGDAGAHRADAILPGAAYTEKNATYVNTEGRVQRTTLATFPLGEAKEDWAIIRALSESMGMTLPYNTLLDLRRRMTEINPVFGAIDEISPAKWGTSKNLKKTSDIAFDYPIGNFYMTDPICRASITMAECAAVATKYNKEIEIGANG